jgi:hypothetical protein
MSLVMRLEDLVVVKKKVCSNLSIFIHHLISDIFWTLEDVRTLHFASTRGQILSQTITGSNNVPINFPKTVCAIQVSPKGPRPNFLTGPRYSMGIGFAEGILKIFLLCYVSVLICTKDLLICVALGVDMVSSPFFVISYIISFAFQADCVFPTRTARFGVALTHKGPLNLSAYLSFRWSRYWLTHP